MLNAKSMTSLDLKKKNAVCPLAMTGSFFFLVALNNLHGDDRDSAVSQSAAEIQCCQHEDYQKILQ